jgi:hypothetical protein
MKKLVVPLALAGMALVSSCTKTVLVSDGENSRTIKVAGKIKTYTDAENRNITTFYSVAGTKYNINTENYALTVIENKMEILK